ncbi:MAG: L,D-transpeptidase [Kiritimatiellia bacterium]
MRAPDQRQHRARHAPLAAGIIFLAAHALAEVAALPAGSLQFAEVVAIQTRLDRLNFSSGCIDGKFGVKTGLAAEIWMKSAATNVPVQLIAGAPGTGAGFFTNHFVSVQEIAALTPIPASWAGKAAMPAMGYETVLEAVAEKYHASQAAIRLLNPGAAWPNPPAGTCLSVPNPFPAAAVRAVRLRISLSRKTVFALDAEGSVAACFPCTIAASAKKRPVGTLKVIAVISKPNYTFDPALFAGDPDAGAMTAKAIIAPGPNNPAGSVWIGLDCPGYGIHGTPDPESVGKAASHGCFRLANWNAEKLHGMVRIGMPVVVTEE